MNIGIAATDRLDPSPRLHIDWPQLLQRLAEPFDSADVQWRAGSTNKDKTKALALAYADARVYEARLDRLCPGAWEVNFEPWGSNRIICRLTVHSVTRSSTGEDSSSTDNAGTTAEAQAFKRACSKFGLGRYLYDLRPTWVTYDAAAKKLVETPTLAARQQPPSSQPEKPSETIGSDRANAMHRELARAGLPGSEHYRFASSVLGRQVHSLAKLTEAEATRIWAKASRKTN